MSNHVDVCVGVVVNACFYNIKSVGSKSLKLILCNVKVVCSSPGNEFSHIPPLKEGVTYLSISLCYE